MENIKYYLWWFANSSFDEFKAACVELANGNQMLADHIWNNMKGYLNNGRNSAAVEFFFYLDESKQKKLAEITYRKYAK